MAIHQSQGHWENLGGSKKNKNVQILALADIAKHANLYSMGNTPQDSFDML